MAVICPTVTAFDLHDYRAQMELLETFAERIHIDLMDGIFAPTKSPSIDQIWLPKAIVADIHLMYQKPSEALEQLIKLKPHLVIIPAEADVDHAQFATKLQANDIKAGLALLSSTNVEDVAGILSLFDHVMIFSGNLGHHGGSVVDFGLLSKVPEIRAILPDAEIAWDGGVNVDNIQQLAAGGIQEFGVGGYIHNAKNPQQAYATLKSVIGA